MTFEIKYYQDMWQHIKDATMTTISKNTGEYPTSEWKTKMIRSEHSPIRLGKFIIKLYKIPSYVATHLARHHVGSLPFVSTRRDDRGWEDKVIDRNTLIDMTIELNFQSILDISCKRLCNCADGKTIKVWGSVLQLIKPYEPELVALCVPSCIYRGHCPEFNTCGSIFSPTYEARKNDYLNYRGIKNE